MRFPILIPLILLVSALGATVGPALAQEPAPKPPERDELPDGVAAIIGNEVVSMDQFRHFLLLRFGKTEEGRQALDNLVEDLLIDSERRRRNVSVTDKELDAYIAKVERDVVRASAGTQTLAELLEQRKKTMEEFRNVSRDFLLRQKMAAADMEIEGQVSNVQLGVWMEELKKKRGVVTGKGLPEGVRAKVADRTLTDEDLSKALLAELPEPRLEAALWDLVISRAVGQRVKVEGIEITDADVERAIEELKEAFRDDPRFKNTSITFESYVQAVRHMPLAELRKDPLFLAQVGLGKVVRRKITAEEVKEYWEANRDRYGESRTFVHLLIKASDRSNAFTKKSRSFKEAKEMIDVLYAKYLRGTPFERLVAEASEDRSKVLPADRPMVVTRATPLPDVLKDAIFKATPGEVTTPVRSPFGYHLLKVTEVRPDRGFEAVQKKVLTDLARERRTRELIEIRQDPAIHLRY